MLWTNYYHQQQIVIAFEDGNGTFSQCLCCCNVQQRNVHLPSWVRFCSRESTSCVIAESRSGAMLATWATKPTCSDCTEIKVHETANFEFIKRSVT